MPWIVQRGHCRACGHRWVAVRPAPRDTEALECSLCHEMTGVADAPPED